MNLVLQILQITNRAVVCLNLVDEAERHGIRIDDRQLMRELGVPVVPVVARSGKGIPELLRNIADVASGAFVCRPKREWTETGSLKKAVGVLAEKIGTEFPGLPNIRWVALRLLEGDQRIIDAIRSGELATLADRQVQNGREEKEYVVQS